MLELAWWIWALALYAIGTMFAIDALWQGRTAQSTIAWVLGLIFVPFLTLPLYAFFGSRHFHGYLRARRHGHDQLDSTIIQTLRLLKPWKQETTPLTQPFLPLFNLPPVAGNHCTLLTTGQSFYQQMFHAIEQAQECVCVQFYILRSDHCGQALAELLAKKVQAGVSCYLLYDEIGSSGISRKYLKKLTQTGVQISRFNSSKLLLRTRLQLNFRNHRKLVLCDGQVAFVGGYNFGDEYLGDGQKRLFWRDTHVKIEGPAALSFQVSFAEDWHWATHKLPQLSWPVPLAKGQDEVMCIATGPADLSESASLYFCHLLHQAKQRCWLVSPYFIPDQNLFNALQLAALRGLDVRILIPGKTDNWLVQQASRNYLPKLMKCGVKFYTYQKGFLHQKVVLLDDEYCSIGSANLDNRSLHINFEINALINSKRLNQEVSAMLLQDFKDAIPTPLNTHWWPTFLTKCARLVSPLL